MPDPSLILHNYGPSPFSEKARVALGIKGASWGSVDVPPMPPRPLLTPMVGGYRRVPVLQVGADFYCDTNIILPALDRLCPGPTLYPGTMPGLAASLSFNWERSIWIAAIGVKVHFADKAPEDFLRDRTDDYLYVDIGKEAMEPDFPLNVQRVRAQLAWLVDTLADGRPFLSGDRPGALDLGYFHALWFIREGSPLAEVDALLGFGPLVAWYDRIAALGHGRPVSMSAETALEAARAATPAPVSHIDDAAFDGLRPGMKVEVTPDDFARVPVIGTLVAADAHEIVLHHDDAKAGDVHVHFPRAGFDMVAA